MTDWRAAGPDMEDSLKSSAISKTYRVALLWGGRVSMGMAKNLHFEIS